MAPVAALALLAAVLGGLDLDCRDPERTVRQLGRARLSEIEQVEDVHWERLHEALAACARAPERARCETERRADFDAGFEKAVGSIEEKYRRRLDELTARCHAPRV